MRRCTLPLNCVRNISVERNGWKVCSTQSSSRERNRSSLLHEILKTVQLRGVISHFWRHILVSLNCVFLNSCVLMENSYIKN